MQYTAIEFTVEKNSKNKKEINVNIKNTDDEKKRAHLTKQQQKNCKIYYKKSIVLM